MDGSRARQFCRALCVVNTEVFSGMFWTVTISLLEGFWGTGKLFALTLVFSLPLGLFICLGSMSRVTILRYPIKFLIWVIRGTPLLLQLLVIYYGPGIILGNNWWGSGTGGRFLAALVAFVINYACYFSEIYRGGIQSIPVGQYEAAEVLGYGKVHTFVRIILPQVVKRILPSVTNEVITLVKDTSMAFTVAYQEMFSIGKQIANSQTSFMPFVIAGVFYFVFNFIVATVMSFFEKRMSYYR